MIEHRDLKLIPDWPRVRRLVAKHLSTTEERVQVIRERGDSLDQIELTVAIEEVLEKQGR